MDSSEFRSTVVSLSPKLFLLAARLLNNEEEAKDAVQEVMVKLWKKRKVLGKHPNPAGYVYLATRNHCLDVLRTREPSIANEWDISMIEGGHNGDDVLEASERDEIIENIIGTLPVRQREVIIMRDIEGLEYDDIETVTGERKDIIRVLVSRARKGIREELNRIYNYEYGTGRKTAKKV